MEVGKIITAYQNSRKPPLTDADLARLWETHQSNVLRIKRGETMPGNKIWPSIQKNTPELYIALYKHYFGINPLESRQRTQNEREGALEKLLRFLHLRR